MEINLGSLPKRRLFMGNKIKIVCLGVLVIAAIFVGIKFFSNDSPEKVVEKMLEAYSKLEVEEGDSFIDWKEDEGFEEFDEEFEEYEEEFVEMVEYLFEEILEYEDIEEVSNNDKRAKVTVKVTAIDYLKTFETLLEDMESNSEVYYYSEEEFMEYYIEELIAGIMDGDTVTNKVTLTLKKDKEGEWKIQDNDELMEIMFGNYKKYKKLYE